MARTRQLVLTLADGGSLGQKREVIAALARYNTAPDGSREGAGVLHGPGLRVELPMVDDKDDVSQLLVTILEEETAWPVLTRLSRTLHWRMMDPESGMSFGG